MHAALQGREAIDECYFDSAKIFENKKKLNGAFSNI